MVAVEAERLMAKGKSSARRVQRAKLLNYARDLARSGEHSDHKSIITLLTALEDAAIVRGWLEDHALHAQLDRLCTMAQDRAHELTSRRVRRGMAKVICEESRI